MKLSIIIPVYNEEKTINRILEKIKAVDLSNLNVKREIIVVDDGSTDNTVANIEKAEKKYHNILIKHQRNHGKGRAVRTGLRAATGDIIIIQDADLEYDPSDYAKLIDPLLKGKSKVVYGSRFLRAPVFSSKRWFFPLHYIGNILLSSITSLLYFKKITDMETGYKVFTRDSLAGLELKSDRFGIEPEITSKILKKRYKILEIPISYYPRNKKQGKKIGIIDGVEAIWCLIKYRFID
jgi:glycosyltransferase involved in cell wall biosynthesis